MEENFNLLEEKVLDFWEKEEIFKATLKPKKKEFVFYEGPPTANAPPGLHHVLARVFKDIICRYKTMRGFRVLRKAGWDTHGLPVELQIEKKLGFKTKKEIENYGIGKFNSECKKSVWEFKKIWETLTKRIGFWIDLENPYITYHPDYIESVWWILKQLWKKKLLYQDFKVVPYCPRCETPLSGHEVALGYQRVKEPAIYVKFKILNPELENTSLLIWTTTPWTLPANVAVAVNPEFDYCQVKLGDEFLILAKERMIALQLKGEITKEMKGKSLVGLKYKPPFDFYQPNFERERIWEVLGADFVSLEEGTGLVHIAPAFGEEDMELIKNENEKSKLENKPTFPILLTVDKEGKFNPEVKKWAGMFVKEADPLIIQDLKERGILFKEEPFEHDYPFCWRCKTPLLYYATKSWFIKMSALKEELIKNNQKINWVPAYIKNGRFGEWLREVKDWALSRERYWGTPLPIWECKNCGHLEAIGSRKDLLSQKFSKNRYFIMRHGHSLMQEKDVLVSKIPERIPTSLTERGKREVEIAAKKLKREKIDLIISSDLQRAKETAEIVAKETGAKLIFDKRLRDISFGIFEGKTLKEYQSFWKSFKERFTKKPKGGESYSDVKKRIFKFLKKLEKKYQGKTILLVSHERPLAMLEGAVKGLKNEEYLKEIEPKKLKTGQFKEIEFKNFPYDEKGELDFHRPYIDEVEFFCPKCGSKMKRVPEVIDCWFDSGAMPFAQYHWPFEQKQLKLFPADYISEGIDQTRGWFYTLLAVSTALGFGPPYKNVISLGHLLDEKGEKMSKSKGNVVDPWYIIGKYGVDSVRWYFFTINQPGDPKLFSERDVFETKKRFIFPFWNCFSFFLLYRKKNIKMKIPSQKNLSLLDLWILSRLEKLILNTTKLLDNYEVVSAARLIENFVINDLSLWYIRRSRRKFQRPETKKELEIASQVLGFVLLSLLKLSAPFIPFLSEWLYQEILNLKFKKKKSVHLEEWPKVQKKLINERLEKKMEKVREVVSLALAERARLKINIRQPLAKLEIPKSHLIKERELLELIKEEVNVKEVVFGEKLKFDTKLTPELKIEGILREVLRQIQAMRKKMNLKPSQKVKVGILAEKELISIFEKERKRILKEGKIKELVFNREIKGGEAIQTKADNKEIKIFVKKI